MTLFPEGIAAVAVAALLLGIAMASGKQRSALRNGGGGSPVSYWSPNAPGIEEAQERLEHGNHVAPRPHASPRITERQAREYHATSERFSSHATPEKSLWNAEQPHGRRSVR